MASCENKGVSPAPVSTNTRCFHRPCCHRSCHSGRIGWYRLAEGLPLSDRHTVHILSKLKRKAA